MTDQSNVYDRLMAEGKRAEADAFAEAHGDDVPWPTEEQFDHAARLGAEYALNQKASGATEPREAPLSGEWAGEPTPRDIAESVGFSEEDAEGISELCDAWENAYFDVFAH